MLTKIDYKLLREEIDNGMSSDEIARRHIVPISTVRRLRFQMKAACAEHNEVTMGAERRRFAIKNGYSDEILAMQGRKASDVLRGHQDQIAWITCRLEHLQGMIEKGKTVTKELKDLRLVVATVADVIDLERQAFAMARDYTNAENRAEAQRQRRRSLEEALVRPNVGGRPDGQGNGALH